MTLIDNNNNNNNNDIDLYFVQYYRRFPGTMHSSGAWLRLTSDSLVLLHTLNNSVDS
jgi:hypothetical protein